MNLLTEIKILDKKEINIVSAGTHMFSDNGNTYAIRYRKIRDFILIDLYLIKDGKPTDIRTGSSKMNISIWSKVLTSISEYIYYNKPETLQIACTDSKLIKFYDHMLIYIKRFREFAGYKTKCYLTNDGALYTITKDIAKADPELHEMLKKYLNET